MSSVTRDIYSLVSVLGDGSSHVSLRFLPSSPVKGFSSLTLVEGSGQRTSHLVKDSETNWDLWILALLTQCDLMNWLNRWRRSPPPCPRCKHTDTSKTNRFIYATHSEEKHPTCLTHGLPCVFIIWKFLFIQPHWFIYSMFTFKCVYVHMCLWLYTLALDP